MQSLMTLTKMEGNVRKNRDIIAKMDKLYEKVPYKDKERAGKDPVTGEKLYKNVTYCTKMHKNISKVDKIEFYF